MKCEARFEQVRGERWQDFEERHGVWRRDLALYLGRRLCGLKLTELAREAEMNNYGVVATNHQEVANCVWSEIAWRSQDASSANDPPKQTLARGERLC